VLQVNPQPDAPQVAVPFAGIGHAVQLEPQLATEVFERQLPLQSWNPELQVSPQLVPSHVAVPLVEVGHAVQREPHVMTDVFDAQVPPQE
jgi:hypothetical protein